MAAAGAGPVAVTYLHDEPVFHSAYASFTGRVVPVKKGLNLIRVFQTTGADKHASFKLSADGQELPKLAGVASGSLHGIWGYVSAIDTTISLSATWNAHDLDHCITVVNVTGVAPTPTDTDGTAWLQKSGVGTFTYTGSKSMTSPAGGVVVSIPMVATSSGASFAAKAPTTEVGRLVESSRLRLALKNEASGPVEFTGPASWYSMLSLAFAPVP